MSVLEEKTIVVKDLRDRMITLGAKDARYDAYPSDAADPEDAEEKVVEDESLSSSGGSLFNGKFSFICLYVISCLLFNMI